VQAQVAPWLIAGWLCESCWQLLFALQTPMSLALCAPVLVFGAYSFITALLACSKTIPGEDKVARLLLVASTAMNAAWMTVAAALAVLVGLAANSHTALTPVAAALAVVVAVIGASITLRVNTAAYSLTLLWAFWGVYSKHPDSDLVESLAMGCCVLFAVLSLCIIVKNFVRKPPAMMDGAEVGETLLNQQ
jgi:hypothetical protein